MFSVIFRGRVRVTTVIQKGIGVLVRFRVGRLGPSRAEFKPKVCLFSVKLGLALTQTLTPLTLSILHKVGFPHVCLSPVDSTKNAGELRPGPIFRFILKRDSPLPVQPLGGPPRPIFLPRSWRTACSRSGSRRGSTCCAATTRRSACSSSWRGRSRWWGATPTGTTWMCVTLCDPVKLVGGSCNGTNRWGSGFEKNPEHVVYQ